MLTAPETRIFTRAQFNAQVAECCGWTEIDDVLTHGKPPNGIGFLPVPNASENLFIAWQVLQFVHREGGELWESMTRLLPADELFPLSTEKAAESICRALCIARFGFDVEVEDWSDEDFD